MTTRDEIIKAAHSYWRRDKWNNEYFAVKEFANFAIEAGRVAEREECAKVCDPYTHGIWFAKAIRARSTK